MRKNPRLEVLKPYVFVALPYNVTKVPQYATVEYSTLLLHLLMHKSVGNRCRVQTYSLCWMVLLKFSRNLKDKLMLLPLLQQKKNLFKRDYLSRVLCIITI